MTSNQSGQRTSPPGSGPGAKLRQARTDLGLSLDEVAQKLHLAARQIEALEGDDYTRLPGPTYIRGYLRSYAELLGLSPAPIIEAYARLPVAGKPAVVANLAPTKQVTSQHHQVKFTTYLVAIIVIALVVAWWQGREPHAPVVRPDAPSGSAVPGPRDLHDSAGLPVPGASVEGADPAAGAADTATGPAIAPVAPEPLPRQPAAGASVSPAGGHPDNDRTAAGLARSSERPMHPAPAGAPTVELGGVAGPRARLVIYTDQESWADVRDARQNKLLYETIPAGRVVTLEGLAPVSVFLGNAGGVRLEYNGKPYDITRHQRGVVARFTLGEAATDGR